MALVTCPECKATISDKSASCISCGAPRTPVPGTPAASATSASGAYALGAEPESGGVGKTIAWIVGCLVVAFFAFGLLSSNSPGSQTRQRDRAAVDLCWQEQGRKSLDPAAARFAASTCERMEADLKRQ